MSSLNEEQAADKERVSLIIFRSEEINILSIFVFSIGRASLISTIISFSPVVSLTHTHTGTQKQTHTYKHRHTDC